MPRPWRFHPSATHQRRVLTEELHVSELAAQVLVNRGIDSVAAARTYISPRMTDLVEPERMRDMPAACDRITHAIRHREKIVVYGDYDVDGLAATALLVQLLNILGAQADVYIPNRLTDSYSITSESARKVIEMGPRLVITVDNGTTALEGIETLSQAGVDVIVTDHHLPGPELPPALALVNPRRDDCDYPFKWLSGVGVAFKLAWGVSCTLSRGKRVTNQLREFLQQATAWTALGTVADVVPLIGENRVLVRFGLPLIAQSPSPGLRALCEASRLGQTVTSTDVGFRLAPRLNAAGRMGEARLALDLLLASTDSTARQVAARLDRLNEKRRSIEQRILQEARGLAEQEFAQDDVMVLAREGWHAGVIGVVASRLVDLLGKPVFMVTLQDGRGKGSARTVPGFHLRDALQECDDLLLAHGGHASAAGLELESTKVCALRERLNGLAAAMDRDDLAASVDIDAEVPFAALTFRLLAELDRFSPFGEGNPAPVFASSDLRLTEPPRPVGAGGAHLQLRLVQGTTELKGIAYGMGDQADALSRADSLQLAYRPHINQFRGCSTVEIQVLDYRCQN